MVPYKHIIPSGIRSTACQGPVLLRDALTDQATTIVLSKLTVIQLNNMQISCYYVLDLLCVT